MNRKTNISLTIGFAACLFVMGLGALMVQPRLKAGMLRDAILPWRGYESFARRWKVFADFLDQNVGETIPLADFFIEINGISQKCLGRQVVQDNRLGWIIKDEKGNLLIPVKDALDEQMGVVDQLLRFKDKIKGLPFVVVIVPDKPSVAKAGYPPGIDNFGAQNLDTFFSLCEKKGIDCLDLRGEITSLDQFFKTDHHWRLSSALLAAQRIGDKLLKNGVLSKRDVDNLKQEQFRCQIYTNSFVGSWGKRVGRVWSGVDDYEVLLPVAETQMTGEMIQAQGGAVVTRSGSWSDVTLDRQFLTSRDKTCNRYASNFGPDFSTITVENEGVKQGNVLMIHDSFGLPVLAYLSLSANRVVSLDVRSYRHQSVEQYVRANPVQAVVLLYNAEQLTISHMFELCSKE